MPMDLSKLSDSDLQALQGNDLSKVSDQGLIVLHSQSNPQYNPNQVANNQDSLTPFLREARDAGSKVYNYLDQAMGKRDSESQAAIAKAQENPLPPTPVPDVGPPGSGIFQLLGKLGKGATGTGMAVAEMTPVVGKYVRGASKLGSLLGALGDEGSAAEQAAPEAAGDKLSNLIKNKNWDFPVQKK